MQQTNNQNSFYISTPLYYPTAKPHLGHAYSTTIADIFNRYKQQRGFHTFFVTGTDEHGEKITNYAQKNKVSNQVFVDKMVVYYYDLWDKLNINYDAFIRTTNGNHVRLVQEILQILINKKDIYFGDYIGLYCANCEEFLTVKQLDSKNNTCLVCLQTPKEIKEPTYFLNVSQGTQLLNSLLMEDNDFLRPQKIKKEMRNNFLKEGIKDLSIGRSSLTWGVPFPNNPQFVAYVWIDALCGYLSALNYLSVDASLFNQFWNEKTEKVQIIGKEIARFHTLYWPYLLSELDIAKPNKILAHGWILAADKHKMSKSLGNIIDPIKLIDEYQSDAVRFFFASSIRFLEDAKVGKTIFLNSYNANLANNIGNLVSRVSAMFLKYRDGKLNYHFKKDDKLPLLTIQTIKKFNDLMDDYQLSQATNHVLKLGAFLNKYIDDVKPWSFDLKTDIGNQAMDLFLTHTIHAIITIYFLLKPILVNTSDLLFNHFGLEIAQIDHAILLNKEKTKNLLKKVMIKTNIHLFNRK